MGGKALPRKLKYHVEEGQMEHGGEEEEHKVQGKK